MDGWYPQGSRIVEGAPHSAPAVGYRAEEDLPWIEQSLRIERDLYPLL